MRLLRLITVNRRHRRYAVVVLTVAVVAAAFGVSFVAAQESRNFLPWFTQANGGGSTGDDETILRVSLGQAAMGRTTSDDFEIVLGFHTGVLAGAPAFAARVRELALTPLPTATSTPRPTATPEPTEVPADASPTVEVVEDTPTQAPPPAEDTPTPEPGIIPTSTAVPATRTPTPPAATPTNTPVVIVVTSVPGPPTATPEIKLTATPFIIVVTAPPADTPTPEPPSGGVCGLPASHGSAPLDLGMLMLLMAPLMLWRIGFKP